MTRSLNRSFVVRINLDQTFSRRTTSTKKHWVGSTFKSFSVIGASHKTFSLSLAPDPVNSKIGSIPLRLGYFQNFKTEVGDACFENTAAQSGRWVDVIFYVEDSMDSNPAEIDIETSIMELGHAKGAMDGLTRIIQLGYGFASGHVRSFDMNDPQVNDGTATINGVALATHWKVPQGFTAEVIGCSALIRTAISAGFLHLHAIADGDTYTEAAAPVANDIGYILNSTDAAGSYNVRIINTGTAGDKGYSRRGIILNEGEIPVLVNESGLDATSDIIVHLMVRLNPITEV